MSAAVELRRAVHAALNADAALDRGAGRRAHP